MKTYIVEGIKNGKESSLELQAPNETACREYLKLEGIQVTRLETNETHHLCGYCHGIVNGTDPYELCEDCKKHFGHNSFLEL